MLEALTNHLFTSQETAGHLRDAPQWPLGGVKTEAPQGMVN